MKKQTKSKILIEVYSGLKLITAFIMGFVVYDYTITQNQHASAFFIALTASYIIAQICFNYWLITNYKESG
jgi:hypothetical protein